MAGRGFGVTVLMIAPVAEEARCRFDYGECRSGAVAERGPHWGRTTRNHASGRSWIAVEPSSLARPAVATGGELARRSDRAVERGIQDRSGDERRGPDLLTATERDHDFPVQNFRAGHPAGQLDDPRQRRGHQGVAHNRDAIPCGASLQRGCPRHVTVPDHCDVNFDHPSHLIRPERQKVRACSFPPLGTWAGQVVPSRTRARHRCRSRGYLDHHAAARARIYRPVRQRHLHRLRRADRSRPRDRDLVGRQSDALPPRRAVPRSRSHHVQHLR